MAELVEGWNGPFDVTIIASGPKKQEDGTQWKGAFPPFAGVLIWDIRVKTPLGDILASIHGAEKPVDGEVLQGAFVEKKPQKDKNKVIKPGKFNLTVYTAEQREAKKQSGGGGYGGGGGKPNYTLEQELAKDGLTIAMIGFSGKVFEKDGKSVPFSSKSLKEYGDIFAKMIIEAGKKAE